jgi:hypothetical protein
MRIVASASAEQLLEESGGRLYVWPKRARCCGGLTTLACSSRLPVGRAFRHAGATGRVEVLVPVDLARLPDELHLEVRGFRRRVEAYWNGCAWVV